MDAVTNSVLVMYPSLLVSRACKYYLLVINSKFYRQYHLECNFSFCFLITKFIITDEAIPVLVLQLLINWSLEPHNRISRQIWLVSSWAWQSHSLPFQWRSTLGLGKRFQKYFHPWNNLLYRGIQGFIFRLLGYNNIVQELLVIEIMLQYSVPCVHSHCINLLWLQSREPPPLQWCWHHVHGTLERTLPLRGSRHCSCQHLWMLQ